jgi:uncharacterized protein with FMN-binding domain
MCGLSLAVVGLSLRAGAHGGPSAPAPAAAGVVLAAAPTATPVAGPTAAPGLPAAATTQPTPRPSPSAAPRRSAVVRRLSPTPVRATTAPPPPAPPAPRSVTVNGTPIDTMYGPVQVQVTVRGGRLVRADAIDYPQGGGRDQEINSQAIPELDDEALQAQSAQIDTVSGATFTSDGYRQSLQSALDAAHAAGAL